MQTILLELNCAIENFSLKPMDLKIDFAKRICITGENGSGKSLLLKTITKYIKFSKQEKLMSHLAYALEI